MKFFKRYVYLKTSAGLANRLRAIDSAVNLSRILEASLVVEWPSNHALAGKFADLFVPPNEFGIIDAPSANGWCSRAKLAIMSATKLSGSYQGGFPARLNKVVARSSRNEYQLSLPMEFFSPWCCLFNLDTDHAFCYPENYSWLRVQSQLKQQIEKLTVLLGSQCVGIHVRRGDHTEAIRNSPDDAFLREISATLQVSPQAIFFLATDDNSLRQRVKAAFGSKIVCQGQVEGRSTVIGAQASVVDLFTLAHCQQIWGSFGSSFTELAFHLGCGDLYIVGRSGRQLIKRNTRRRLVW